MNQDSGNKEIQIPDGTRFTQSEYSSKANNLAHKEIEEFNQKTYKETQEREKEQVKNKKQNRKLRKDFAYKAYSLATGCICFWMVIVPLSAVVHFVTGREFLSDTALGIVTTGVTINVFAALLTVIKGLFSNIEE